MVKLIAGYWLDFHHLRVFILKKWTLFGTVRLQTADHKGNKAKKEEDKEL